MTTDDDPSTPTLTDLDTSDAVEGLAEVPQVPDRPVHPLAASFPMLEGEELDDLADDIREHGLHHPIVLDTTGQVIAGRNRLKACQMAGVEPIFVTVDTDPIAYILSENVIRRHLSKGQQAMAYAMAYPDATNKGGRGKKNLENDSPSFDRHLLSQSRFVLRHTPDIAMKVMAGSSSLADAYTTATTKKREQDEYEQLRKQTQDGVEAIAAICARWTSAVEKWDTAFLDQEDFVRQVYARVSGISCVGHSMRSVYAPQTEVIDP